MSVVPKRAPEETERDVERSADARSTRDARSAGTSPKTITDNTETPSVKARMRALGPTASEIGSPSEAIVTRSRLPHHATTSAAMPLKSASTRLSTNSCRTIRPRLAPIASRSDISRRRAMPRASRRFAIFTQTIPSNSATPAIKVTSGAANGPRTDDSPRAPGANMVVMPRSLISASSSGAALATTADLMTGVNCARTCSSVSPAFGRPMSRSHIIR